MREHFVQEIKDINQDVLHMAIRVEEMLAKAGKALVEKDVELAREVIRADHEVDAAELSLGDRCVVVIAKQSPVASDLRHLVGVLKIVTDIERIGDFAVHVAKRARDLADEEYAKPLVDIPRMIELGARMLKDAVQAFVTRDETLARTTALLDEEMDSLNKQVNREFLTLMLENPATIRQANKLTYLSRVLERLGDHAVGICNWTVYSVNGTHEEL